MISIATPTHNPEYLDDLYNSLLSQSVKDWVWVILVNNTDRRVKYNLSDQRVKVIYDRTGNKNIGYLKNKAFTKAAAISDYVVEVDHDDILEPDALESILNAFQDDEIGFVYSDNVKFGKQFKAYSEAFGWEQYEHDGSIAMRSFDAEPGAMSRIWFMPDHVRAWRSSVYQEIGGHNVDLDVLDDQDLMARTYLATKFKHIPRVLYRYRLQLDGNNTYLKKNAKIQTETVKIGNAYLQKMCERYAELNDLPMVDLGGSINPRQGYTVIDSHKCDGVDIVHDLNEGIPLPDNSVYIINASHVLEHLKDVNKSMREIHRVLIDGGFAFISVPSTDGRGAWQDPTHVSYWNENTFLYYTDPQIGKYIRNDHCYFQKFQLDTIEWKYPPAVKEVKAILQVVKSNKRRPILDARSKNHGK